MNNSKKLKKFNKEYKKCISEFEKIKVYYKYTTQQNNNVIAKKISEIENQLKDDSVSNEIESILKRENTIEKIQKVLDEGNLTNDISQTLKNADIHKLKDLFTNQLMEIKSLQNTYSEMEELLYQKEVTLKQSEIELREKEVKQQEEDFYNRKQITKINQNVYGKVVIILLIAIITTYFFFLLPSIKRRIEYNPYETVKTNEQLINSDKEINSSFSLEIGK